MSDKKQEKLLDNVEKLLILRAYLNHDFRLKLGNLGSSLEIEDNEISDDIYKLLEELSEVLDSNKIDLDTIWYLSDKTYKVDSDISRQFKETDELKKAILQYRPKVLIFDLNHISKNSLNEFYLQYNGIVEIKVINGQYKDCETISLSDL